MRSIISNLSFSLFIKQHRSAPRLQRLPSIISPIKSPLRKTNIGGIGIARGLLSMKQQKLSKFFKNMSTDSAKDSPTKGEKRLKGSKKIKRSNSNEEIKEEEFDTPKKIFKTESTTPTKEANVRKGQEALPFLTPVYSEANSPLKFKNNEFAGLVQPIYEENEGEGGKGELEYGKPVPYKFLANVFDAISSTKKRLEIAEHLKKTFSEIIVKAPEDLLPCIYLCVTQICPSHEGLELGVGDSLIIKAMAEAFGRKPDDIKKSYQKYGDLGIVAMQEKTKQLLLRDFKPLTIRSVFKSFEVIAKTTGESSVERKRRFITKLISEAKKNEIPYIVKSIHGKLRIGVAEQTVLISLAQAVYEEVDEKVLDKESSKDNIEQAVQNVKQAYGFCPSYDKLVPALLKFGATKILDHISFVPGVPVHPMLAKPTNGISEILDKFSNAEFTCEYKYDGERVQIHVIGKEVNIFSRNLENIYGKYPDIAAMIPKNLKPEITSVVIDSEAVAWNTAEQKVLPFQILSTRARKDVKLDDIKIKVCLFCFDCLYLNGVSLLQMPLAERRRALYSAIDENKGTIEFAKAKSSNNIEDLQVFLDMAVDYGTEGLIVKSLDATYEPTKRSVNWLKLKKDYLDGVGDTFDVVPIGAWHGRGKRKGMFGSFLLAIYDDVNEEYQTISKIGTGFSDDVLKSCSDRLKEHIISAPPKDYKYGETLIPDVWFATKLVWEIKAADLSLSPLHKAASGIIAESKGISIRFPRLVRIRDDKSPEDATKADEVVEMYKKQFTKNSQS